MPDNDQKRAHPRTEIVFKIDYRTPGAFAADYTANAGSGGVFIATRQPFAVGDTITFNISFPGLVAPIVCVGRIRWRRSPEEAEEGRPAGIGVEFQFDSSDQADRIRELVDSITDTGQAPAPSRPGAGDASGPAFRMLLAGARKSVLRMFRIAMDSSSMNNATDRKRLEVDEVENARDAWQRLERDGYDLVVLDLDTPAMEGEALLDRIRSSTATRDLAVAAVGSEDHREKARAAGADLFLDTPINLVKLFQSLLRLLRVHGHPGEPDRPPDPA